MLRIYKEIKFRENMIHVGGILLLASQFVTLCHDN